MEQLFEFMFGASGRINRAGYWKSLLILCVAGLIVSVVLLTAAGLAAPLFIIAAVISFLPWLMWGFSIHTERLHDRNKSAWWLVVFYLLPSVLGHLANLSLLDSAAAVALHYALAMAAFVLTIWGFVEIGCLRGTAGSNRYGPNPLAR
jgi:uncharacterized membrane protein YhaH (DUF805 family)